MSDENRTHLLGHIIDKGNYTEGVCSDKCWCKKGDIMYG